MKRLLFFLSTMILFSCSHFHDDPSKSVWGGGLFILPWLTGLGSIACFVMAYLSSKSNSTTQTNGGYGPTKDNTGNVPITKLGLFWFGVALAVATIVIIISVNSGR